MKIASNYTDQDLKLEKLNHNKLKHRVDIHDICSNLEKNRDNRTHDGMFR